MNPVDLLRGISLHDAIVNEIAFDAAAGALRLKLEIGNYVQADHDPGTRLEVLPGELLFEGVAELDYEPEQALATWGDQVDGEIINIEAVPTSAERSRVILVLAVVNYGSKKSDICIFRFEASECAWSPA